MKNRKKILMTAGVACLTLLLCFSLGVAQEKEKSTGCGKACAGGVECNKGQCEGGCQCGDECQGKESSCSESKGCCGTCGGSEACAGGQECNKGQCEGGCQCGDECQDKKSSCCGTCGGDETCCGTCGGSAQIDFTAFLSCEICSQAMSDMDLMMACDWQIADTKEGSVFVAYCKNSELVPKLHAFNKRDKALSDKYKAMSAEECSKKLCPLCAEYMVLARSGLTEERIETPTGAITLVKTECPVMRKKLHAWNGKVRKMFSAFENSTVDVIGVGGASGTDFTKAMSEMPAEWLEAMGKCEVCRTYMENPAMMTASEMNAIMLKNGMAICNTVKDAAKIAEYQAFEKRFHDKVEKLKKLSYEDAKSRMCGMCMQFADLERSGALIEWHNTPTGTLTIMTAGEPRTVDKIHDLGKQLKAFEKM